MLSDIDTSTVTAESDTSAPSPADIDAARHAAAVARRRVAMVLARGESRAAADDARRADAVAARNAALAQRAIRLEQASRRRDALEWASQRREVLEALLFDRRISRAEMCRRADMCPVSVIHWIHRGDPGPTPKQARVVHKTRVTTANLAAALGVPVEAFGMGAAS